jgi:hypothetical protein
MNLQDALWFDTSKGRIGILMVLDWHTEKLHYVMGVASGMNDNVDINHIYSGGVYLPDYIGASFFFGDWE